MEVSSFNLEFNEISREFNERKERLDENLKIKFRPIDGGFLVESKLVDLFMSRVYYPELVDYNYIMFSELSNECMKRILEESFTLTFSRDENNDMKVYGKSETDVELTGMYFKPHNGKLNELLNKFRSEVGSEEGREQSLPKINTLIELVPRTALIEIKLPAGYFI